MAEHDRHPTFREFRAVLEESPAKAAAMLEGVHAADVAGWFQDLPDQDMWHVFSALDTETQAEVLEYADSALRAELVPRLSSEDLTELALELPPDEAVDILAEADERVVEDVLSAMPAEDADELRDLISHDEESAGGVMTSEVVAVPRGSRIGDAIKLVKKESETAEESLGVWVVDGEGKPVGYIANADLITHSIHEPVEEVMVEPFTVAVTADQEEAANIAVKYDLRALAVVDESGALAGVLSAEDAQEILSEEVHEDLMRMVGTAPDQQQTRLPILTRVRQRLPLMGVTVLGGLLTARILGVFLGGGTHGGEAAGVEGQIDGSAILRYLPIIIGLAGNVGIQSSTILVRGFATGEVEREREPSVLFAEVVVGLCIGLLCGAASALVAGWMESDAAWLAQSMLEPLEFGGALGIAITIAVTWAALLGCMVPMGCRRLGIDPAIVAGPFLICLSDISGSAIYIVVSQALIRWAI